MSNNQENIITQDEANNIERIVHDHLKRRRQIKNMFRRKHEEISQGTITRVEKLLEKRKRQDDAIEKLENLLFNTRHLYADQNIYRRLL